MTQAKVALYALIFAAATVQAQTIPAVPAAPAQPNPRPDPAITQIRKSVTFIKLRCSDAGQEFDVRGTGFFVSYPDPRLPNDGSFNYLVTNRHVALCWNDLGHPMQVESIGITLNGRDSPDGIFSQDVSLNDHGNIPWIIPQDDSVDLAVIGLALNPSVCDFVQIPLSLFASNVDLKRWRVTEGEPIFFAGFFYQFPGRERMEPIVRQGIISMMPSDKVPFGGMAEQVYLADAHAFGGNSGSPVFFNLGGFREGNIMAGDDYHLLGVVNGMLTEDENFNLQLAATLKGKASANSGISTIVPADELRALLDDPRLQKMRDDALNAIKTQRPAH